MILRLCYPWGSGAGGGGDDGGDRICLYIFCLCHFLNLECMTRQKRKKVEIGNDRQTDEHIKRKKL